MVAAARQATPPAYDGLRPRIKKVVGEDTFDYYYNESWQVIGTYKSGDPVTAYVGNRVASVFPLFPHDGPKVVYGEGNRLGRDRLRREGITFRRIP